MNASGGIELKKILDRYLGIPGLYALRSIDSFTSLFRPERPLHVERILLSKLWGVGNLVMILPFVRALRRRFPEAKISFLTIASQRSLLENHPDLDQVYTIRTDSLLAPIQDILALIPKLRKQRFDLFLDFEQFLRITPILGYLSGAPQRIGLETPGQARAALFNAKVPYRKDRHMSVVFGDVVRSSGVEVSGLPPLWVPRDDTARREVEQTLSSMGIQRTGPLVALHPGSGDNFPGRRWPAERFASLGDRLVRERAAQVVVTGARGESELVAKVVSRMQEKALNLCGTFSLEAFIELVASLDLLVTNDTAPVHIGSALGVPLVALYGPNTPDLYGPLHDASHVVYNRLPCSPCLSNLSAKSSSCRLPACMLGVDVETVFTGAIRLLDGLSKTSTDPKPKDPKPKDPKPKDASPEDPDIGDETRCLS